MSSFVDDIILPPVSLISPSNNNLDGKFAVLRDGGRGGRTYATLKEARADGAVVMAYGYVDSSSLCRDFDGRETRVCGRDHG